MFDGEAVGVSVGIVVGGITVGIVGLSAQGLCEPHFTRFFPISYKATTKIPQTIAFCLLAKQPPLPLNLGGYILGITSGGSGLNNFSFLSLNTGGGGTIA